MANYATVTDMINRFTEEEIIQISDPDSTGGVVPAIVTRALSDATEEMNSYIGVLYPIPLIVFPIPEILVRICCDIARYRLYDDKPIEEVYKRYRAALTWLHDIARGVALLSPGLQRVSMVSSVEVSPPRPTVFTQTILDSMNPVI